MNGDQVVMKDCEESSDGDESDFDEVDVSGDDMTRLMALEEEISKQSNDYNKHVEVGVGIVGFCCETRCCKTSNVGHRTLKFGTRRHALVALI